MNSLIIGLIDSGINIRHPHIRSKVIEGISIYKFNKKINYSKDTNDFIGHGTAVTAVINDIYPDTLIFPVKIFYDNLETDIDLLYHALLWFMDKPVDIVNMSLSILNEDRKIEKIKEVLLQLTSKEILIVMPHSLYKLVKDKFKNDSFLIPCGVDKRLNPYHYYTKHNIFFASPWAKKLNGLSKEKNFNGVSFSCSRLTGIIGKTIKSVFLKSKADIKDFLKNNKKYVLSTIIRKEEG